MTSVPPAVRVLPMDAKGEFLGWSISYTQQSWFLRELISDHKGRYRYRKNGLNTPVGSTVLFQYDGYIIALAVLTGTERFRQADSEGYNGALYFDVNSIKVFDPVRPSALARIWPEFNFLYVSEPCPGRRF